MQLTDSLDKFLKEYNADGRYHLILSNTAKDNVLYGVPGYDITNEVINGLNARCKK
jgi:outer membrane protein